MKKDEAQSWQERLTAGLEPLTARLGGAPRVAPRLYHDEVDGEARWAMRLAPESWPFEPGAAGQAARPGLRWEVWFRPGKAADLPVSVLAVCDGEAALESLRESLNPVWMDLVRGGKTAGRYKLLADGEPLACRLDRAATGIARQVPPRADRVEAALAQLLLDTHKPLGAAVDAWRAAGGEASFVESERDPFAALRQRFPG